MTADKKYISQVNSHVEDYLDYYCGLSHSPEFAVLLKGEWGCGKTWFIKKYCEKLKRDNQKYLYISLYGMTSTTQIEDEFFRQLHPFLSSKGVAITGKILQAALKTTLRVNLGDFNNNGQNDVNASLQLPQIDLPESFKKADESILIFDDLERCQIDIDNILGYINYFVEHQGLKAIIVANEEKLLEINNEENINDNEYNNIKEKLIGKTFEITFDLHSALKDFLEQIESSEIEKIFNDNAQLIEEIYQEAQYRNLRSLKQIILDFERIFQELPDKAKNKPELLEEILKFLTAFYIEIKRGNLLPQDINKLAEIYTTKNRRNNNQTKSQSDSISADTHQEQNKIKQNIEIYQRFEIYLNNPFLSLSWWHIFFDKGIISKTLQESISNSVFFIDKNMPNWTRLWHFNDTDLSDEDFYKLLKKVESEYANREFTDLQEIKQITGIFLNVSDLGFYEKSKENILQDAKQYIDDLIKDNKLELNPITNPIVKLIESTSSHGGLGFQGLELDEFKNFLDYITTARNLAVEAMLPKWGLELLEIMSKDVSQFYKMICVNENFISDNVTSFSHTEYSSIPILKKIQPELFLEKFLSMKFRDQAMCVLAIKERYKYVKDDEKIVDEISWLESLQKLLLKEIKKNKPSGFRL